MNIQAGIKVRLSCLCTYVHMSELFYMEIMELNIGFVSMLSLTEGLQGYTGVLCRWLHYWLVCRKIATTNYSETGYT